MYGVENVAPVPKNVPFLGAVGQSSQDFWGPAPNAKDYWLVKAHLFACWHVMAILKPSKYSSDSKNKVTELQEDDWKSYFKKVFTFKKKFCNFFYVILVIFQQEMSW